MLDRLIEVLAWYGGIMVAVQIFAYANRNNYDPAAFIVMQGIGWGALTFIVGIFHVLAGPNVWY
ncbi:hypothetical protein [Roseovarius amoyensis]|uniref:hypothetical protein n=1 Tax=Roseovarius amoyensis TaxID=2211448 RepID=UPI000DBE35D5|nr:hypothetical protein [Roseovarius amoyensis]